MTRRSWLLGVTLVLAAAVVPAALAQAAQPAPGNTRHGRWEGRLQQQLGLTDQQAQAIREIHARQSQALKTRAQALRQAQAELRRLVLIEADQGTVQVKLEEVQRLLGETVQMRVNTLKEVAPILLGASRPDGRVTGRLARPVIADAWLSAPGTAGGASRRRP